MFAFTPQGHHNKPGINEGAFMPVLYSLFCTALMALAVSLVPSPSGAQDIFIRPNTNNNAGSTPGVPSVEYGVKPRPKPTKPPASTTTTTNTTPTSPAPATPEPSPAPAPAPIPAPTPAPSPTPSPPSPTPPPGEGGATVYQVPEDPPPDPGEGANTLTINFLPGGLGVSDRNAVMQTLGLSEAEIQRACALRHGVMLSYGQGGGTFLPAGTAASLQYRFTAPLVSLQVSPVIGCQRLRAPVSGMVLEQGNYYTIALSTVDCPPGAKGGGNTALSFRYTGDGKGECRYQ